MASDHRGNPVHAGKRTRFDDQIEFSSTLEQSAPTQKGSYAWRTSDGPTGFRGRRTVYGVVTRGGYADQLVHQPENGKTSWSVTVPQHHGLDPETAQGRYGVIKGDEITIMGKVSTPGRAAIAAQAMTNRINEGRDLKTGRPKK